MSGIIGIYRSGDNQREPQVLEPVLKSMAATLAHRGPDGRNFWAEEAVRDNMPDGVGIGLGHLALHATPEAHAEELPLRCEEKSLVLTNDARLDNRDELLPLLRPQLEQMLGATPSEPLIGDSLLILAAYMRWKGDCARHLLGDFAFAIWDGEAQELFCARDHVGVKPFYYVHQARHEAGGAEMFAFASEIKALLEVPGVARRVDEERVAKYLLVAFDSFEDTAFEGIRRLPPAHTLSLSARGLEIERYWDLKGVPMLSGLSDGEYEQRFRETLFEAVRCRMRAPQGEDALGGFLSGGLDSSAVMCVARAVERERSEPTSLPVFSAVFDKVPACDERPWIQAVLAGGGLKPHWIRGEERSPLMNLESVLWHTDEPALGPNLCSAWTHYKPAREAGVRVLLDGHGGDETVGYGLPRLSEMVQSGSWREVWRELRLLEGHGFLQGGPGASKIMRRSLAHGLPPLRLARRLKHGLARRASGLLKRGRGQNVAREQSEPEAGPDKPVWKALLREEFAARIGAEAMHRKSQASEPRNVDGDRKYNESTLSAPLQALAFEELSKAAAAAGVEARYPLWDKRLVELCLSMPPEQKLKDGWTRSILRRALEGVLPREVQWRGSKVDFTPEAWHGMREHDNERLSKLAAKELVWSAEFVDEDEASRCARLILDREESMPGPSPLVVRAAALECWLGMQHGLEEELKERRRMEAAEGAEGDEVNTPIQSPSLEREPEREPREVELAALE